MEPPAGEIPAKEPPAGEAPAEEPSAEKTSDAEKETAASADWENELASVRLLQKKLRLVLRLCPDNFRIDSRVHKDFFDRVVVVLIFFLLFTQLKRVNGIACMEKQLDAIRDELKKFLVMDTGEQYDFEETD